MEDLEEALNKMSLTKAKELFYSAVRPAVLQATNGSAKKRAVAWI